MLANYNTVSSRSNTPFTVKDILNLPDGPLLNFINIEKMFSESLDVNYNESLHYQEDSHRWDITNSEMPLMCDETPEPYAQENECRNIHSPSSTSPNHVPSADPLSFAMANIQLISNPTQIVYPPVQSSPEFCTNGFVNHIPEWPITKEMERARGTSDTPASNSKYSLNYFI